MKFTHQNWEVALQGLVLAATNLEVGEAIPKKAGADCKGVWLQIVGTEAPKPKQFQHPTIIDLLDGFKSIFKEPKVATN
jgi:hypothetical protein